MSDEPMLLTTAALAAELGVSKTHVRRWTNAGTILNVGTGRARQYALEDVRRALEAVGWRGNQQTRRQADLSGEERTCSRCERSLPLDQFPPSTGVSCGWHCRSCRREEKRDYRRRQAAADGRPFRPYGDRATWEAQRRAAREQRKAYRLVAWAVCLAFRALVKLTPEEQRQRSIAGKVRRQRERYNADPDYQARMKAKKIRRKRATRGTQVVPVNRERVAERDHWRCGLCGGIVTRVNWSLDHIVPLSLGGSHTYENVQLAHRSCNSRKGNRAWAVPPRVDQKDFLDMAPSRVKPGAGFTQIQLLTIMGHDLTGS